MKKISLKTRLMNFCESFGPDAEFTWSQLHEFLVLETLKSSPDKVKYFFESELDEEDRESSIKKFGLIGKTYEQCINLYFKNPSKWRGFMCSPLSNPGSWADDWGTNYMRYPSKNEPRYLKKNASGKYVLTRAA